ncbi:MAG TPA: carbonic anhydrase [Myxococcales bacterium]|nr:carbonic anhydrase [Myxococcales bacterium]
MRNMILVVGFLVTAGLAIAQSGEPLVERVLSRQEQEALTPDEVLMHLKRGNQRFLSGDVTNRDHSAQVRDAAGGQFPKAMILSCVDSRVPVEDVFDQGIGDVFVARVAGNFENTDILGSMEFATKISGAKLILVLGHEDCGAVKAAIDGAELGNITEMLTNIKPAVDALSDYAGDQTSANPEFVHLVAEKNIRLSMQDIRTRSPILKQMEKQGQLKISGALYDMKTGKVDFFE